MSVRLSACLSRMKEFAYTSISCICRILIAEFAIRYVCLRDRRWLNVVGASGYRKHSPMVLRCSEQADGLIDVSA